MHKENNRFNFYFDEPKVIADQIRDLNCKFESQNLPVFLLPDYIDCLGPVQAVQPMKTKVLKEAKIKK